MKTFRVDIRFGSYGCTITRCTNVYFSGNKPENDTVIECILPIIIPAPNILDIKCEKITENNYEVRIPNKNIEYLCVYEPKENSLNKRKL
jgi:hypothetical protein